MALQKGRQQPVGIKRETTRLTAETTGFTFLPWTEFMSKNVNAYTDDNSSFGSRGAMLSRPLVSQHAEASFGSKIDADYILPALHFIFGTSTPTTALGATTWAGSVNQLLEGPTATIIFQANDENWKAVRGWQASKLDLDLSTDDATYAIEGAGIVEQAASNPTASLTAPNKYLLGRHTTISYATTQAGLNSGTVITGVKNVKVSFETGVDIERHKVLGSLNPTNVSGDGFMATIEFDVISQGAQSGTIQGWHDAGTDMAIRVDVNATDLPVISTSALRPRLTLNFPPSKIEVEREIPLDDYLLQKCKITVNRADLSTYTLINSIATI